MFLTVMLMHLP